MGNGRAGTMRFAPIEGMEVRCRSAAREAGASSSMTIDAPPTFSGAQVAVKPPHHGGELARRSWAISLPKRVA